MLDAATVQVTRHAWQRFTTRWPDGRLPGCPESTLRKLLAKAQPEDLGAGAVRRLIQNGTPMRYCTSDGWRFVFTEDYKTLVTCERIYLKRPGPPPKMSRKRSWRL